jgi:hypothetical protein
VSRNWSERKIAWLIAGIGLGVGLAAYWPNEQMAFAETAVSGEKFAMCTMQTSPGDAEAIFILDFATGRLVGAVFNNKLNEFSQPLIRNIAQDFGLTDAGKYVMISGFTGARSRGGQPAAGGLYVAELTSGRLALYSFINVTQGNNRTQELSVLGTFPWRAAAN